MKDNIKVAWIGAFAAIVTAVVPIICKSKTGENYTPSNNSDKVIAGVVEEENSRKSIGQADIVILGINNNKSYPTPDNGIFRIHIKEKDIESVRLRVTKEHYKPVEQDYAIPDENVTIVMTYEK